MFAPALERAAFVVPSVPSSQSTPGSGATTTGRRLSQVHAPCMDGRPIRSTSPHGRANFFRNPLLHLCWLPTSRERSPASLLPQTTNIVAAAPALELEVVPVIVPAPTTTGTETMPSGTAGTGRRLSQVRAPYMEPTAHAREHATPDWPAAFCHLYTVCSCASRRPPHPPCSPPASLLPQTTNLVAAAPALELEVVPVIVPAPTTTGTETMPSGTAGTGRRLSQVHGG